MAEESAQGRVRDAREAGGGRRAGQWGPGNGRYGSPTTTLFVFFGLLLRFPGNFCFFHPNFCVRFLGVQVPRARPREHS